MARSFLYQKPKLYFPIWIASLVFSVFLTNCTHHSFSEEAQKDEYGEKVAHEHLVAVQAYTDNVTSSQYRMKVQTEKLVHCSARQVDKITAKRYPFSVIRKVDDIVFGTLCLPLTPFALVGGVVTQDTEIMFFPFTALCPWKNYKPNEAGLLTGPVAGEYKSDLVTGNWQYLGDITQKTDWNHEEISISQGDKRLSTSSDEEGNIVLDLNEIVSRGAYTSLRVEVADGRRVEHRIPAKRFRLLNRFSDGEKQPELQVPNKPRTPKKYVAPEKKSSPPAILSTSSSPNLALYFNHNHSYWVQAQSGLPLVVTPLQPLGTYSDKLLKAQTSRAIQAAQGLYVLGFHFSSQGLFSVEVSTKPGKENSLGWVSSEQIYLWNSINRLSAEGKFRVYSSLLACQRKDQKKSKVLSLSSSRSQLFLPVLGKEDSFWKIAFHMKGTIQFQTGWIDWDNSPNLKVGVRVLKHRLDQGIQYLEKSVAAKEKQEVLGKESFLRLDGPLLIKRPINGLALKRWRKHKEFDKSIMRPLLQIPEDEQAKQLWEASILRISDLVSERNLWEEKEDMVYISAQRD